LIGQRKVYCQSIGGRSEHGKGIDSI